MLSQDLVFGDPVRVDELPGEVDARHGRLQRQPTVGRVRRRGITVKGFCCRVGGKGRRGINHRGVGGGGSLIACKGETLSKTAHGGVRYVEVGDVETGDRGGHAVLLEDHVDGDRISVGRRIRGDGGTELRDGLEQIDEDGGSSTLDIVVRDSGGARVDSRPVFEALEAFQDALDADSAVGVVVSPTTLVGHARTLPLARLLPPQVLRQPLQLLHLQVLQQVLQLVLQLLPQPSLQLTLQLFLLILQLILQRILQLIHFV